MPKRVPLVMLVATIASGAEAQTITFPNVTPATTIRLEAGSTLSIDANGNLIARCDASDPAGCARLFQSGSGGNQCGPAVTFTAPLNVTSPTNPPAPGPYPAGSQLTIGAQVSGAAVCVPSATPRGNSWTFEDTGQADIPYVVGVPGQPNVSTPSQCVLEPGRTYYLNIYMSKPNRATRSLTPANPICPSSDCGHGIRAGG